MAKKKAITKKKAAPKKKVAEKEQTAVPEADSIAVVTDGIEMEEPEIAADKTITAVADAIADDEYEVPVVIMEQDLIIELCGPGKRCRQRIDGKFIRQNFIAGRWQQVSGTVFSTLEACKTACGG
jgi:disulfide oxidoreductase YuzD